jgi:hypothetical protein
LTFQLAVALVVCQQFSFSDLVCPGMGPWSHGMKVRINTFHVSISHIGFVFPTAALKFW